MIINEFEKSLQQLKEGKKITAYNPDNRLERHILSIINQDGGVSLPYPNTNIEELLHLLAYQYSHNSASTASINELNFMGDWIENNEYHPNDIVIDPVDENQYICEVKVSNSDVIPSLDEKHWHLFIRGGLNVLGVTIDPPTAQIGIFTKYEFDLLSENSLNYISRNGEIYRLVDVSDSEYYTYAHFSIDTSKANKPSVIRTIRVNLNTYAWEYSSYDLISINSLPSDATTKTYVLKAVNGNIEWVEE